PQRPSSAEVALDGPRVAHVRVGGILARVAQRSPLAQVVPQAIEFDPYLLEAPRVGRHLVGARGVGRRLLVAAQPLLLALELLDPSLHLLVAHRWGHGMTLPPRLVPDSAPRGCSDGATTGQRSPPP